MRRLAGERGEEVRKAREYLETKVRAATWLIKSIHWRQQTLYRVSESIFSFQRDFLEHGVTRLKPLVLREVASEIGMHPSTVSRATSKQVRAYAPGCFRAEVFLSERDFP